MSKLTQEEKEMTISLVSRHIKEIRTNGSKRGRDKDTCNKFANEYELLLEKLKIEFSHEE